MQEKDNSQTLTIVLIAILIIAIVGLIVWGFSGSSDDTTDNDSDDTQINQDDNTVNDTTDSSTDTTIDPTEDTETETQNNDTPVTPLAEFSTNKQTIGEDVQEAIYNINKISDSSQGTEYHKIVFTTSYNSQDNENAIGYPKVSAEYQKDRGGIEVKIQGIQEDNSGIKHLNSVKINESGITEIYKNITSEKNTSIYTIGTSKETPFKLYIDDTDSSKIILDIQYPGEVEYNHDLGKDNEFGTEKQSLDGAIKPDGAEVKKFSYSNVSGTLTLQFEVAGSKDKPIPQVYTEYIDGDLHLVFPSLANHQANSDRTYSGIPAAGEVKLEIDGDKSTYIIGSGTFTDNEFKLEGSLSPNQIILKVKN